MGIAMEKNYTPLNIEALYPKKAEEPRREEPAHNESRQGFDSTANTILLSLAALTVLVVSIVLFVLIQKHLNGQSMKPASLPVASLGVFHG